MIKRAILGAVALSAVCAVLPASPAFAEFDIASFTGGAFTQSGASYTQAAGHPYEATTTIEFPSLGLTVPDGQVKDVSVEAPPGLIGNPGIVPVRCTSEQLQSVGGQEPLCPMDSQVGVATVVFAGQSESEVNAPFPLYLMVPPPGSVAVLAFRIGTAPVMLFGKIRSDGDYGISIDSREISQEPAIQSVKVSLWGVPADPSHDTLRGRGTGVYAGQSCALLNTVGFPCSNSAGYEPAAFLTNPANCSAGPLTTNARADSWQEPGVFKVASFNSDTNGNPTAVTGCDQLRFDPEISFRPNSSQADSPTGLDVNLAMPNYGLTNPEGVSEAALKKASVTLPDGVSVNPASAAGLGSCSAQQIGMTQAGLHPKFSLASPSCPDSSKLGTVKIETSLLDRTLEGSIYLGAQNDPAVAGDENPFGSLLSLYLVVDDPETGIVLKLPGRVDADPETGRLTATFDNNPQLPFSSLQLHFKTGSRASLITPATCGSYDIVSRFSSWSAADVDNPSPGEIVTKTNSFEVTSGPDGSPCPAQAKFDPGFNAGTTTPIAGAYSPLIVNASRPDGSQSLQGLDLTLPKGLTGKLAGVQACSNTALSATGSKSGAAELASRSCPATSKVGTVDVAAGAGSTPFHVQGTAYLAGPYKGAPLSLAVITPAVAGPFDLGTVVVRAAAQIDPVTTQIKVTSDPIPSILQGIPLKVRSVSVNTDRPEFTLNPTSCDPMSLEGTLFGSTASKSVSNRFQVGACKALDFAPKLALSLKGATHRRAHPALKAVLTAKPGEANIARAQVKLPKAAFLDNAHIGEVCTRPAFANHTCPPGSVYGKVSATTPILDYALSGSVYLRANPAHKLPDLVADLRGPDTQPIEIELAGKTDSVKGALRNTFEAVPDAPVTKFTLELFGGKKGLIELSSGLCAHPRASVKLDAQSGAAFDTTPKVRADCGKGKKRR